MISDSDKEVPAGGQRRVQITFQAPLIQKRGEQNDSVMSAQEQLLKLKLDEARRGVNH